jgi:hypothetical protein
MKRIVIIGLVFAALIFSNSCNEWLYLEPENGIIRQEYWKSKEDVHAAVMGIYASLLGNPPDIKGYNVPELLFIWGEIRGDMISLSRLRTDFQYVINGDILPDNGICKWNAFYRTINYCNTVLEFAPDVRKIDPSFTQEALNNYLAEARAIRALMYYYLARTFGEVPIKLTASKSDVEKFDIPKSPHQKVLTQIKRDLVLAEKEAPISYDNVAATKGRITKYTVNAIQADVYLWNDQYDSCVFACNKIINSGFFGLLEGDEFWFTNLYVDGNSSESIFELQFSQEILNPYYSMLSRNKYFKASAGAIEEYFPADLNQLPDSADIRADGASYKLSDNYTIWKYIGRNREEARAEYEAYGNWIVYRYAEILLFKAEALNQMGMGSDALAILKTIRKRSHASKSSSLGEITDERTLSEFILAERCREFAYEGKRWYDVLRVARRNNYERIDLLLNMVVLSAPSDKQVTILNKYRDTRSHYLPIFYTELEANPALEQNPFYGEFESFIQ